MQHRLQELRKAKSITQRRLAIDLGIDQASISSYECGKYFPTVEILLKLAEYFGVSTDYLLGVSDVKTPLKYTANDQSSYMLFQGKKFAKKLSGTSYRICRGAKGTIAKMNKRAIRSHLSVS